MCQIEKASTGTMVSPLRCISVEQRILLVNVGDQTWVPSTGRKIKVLGQIKTPLINGTYIFNVDVYDSDGEKLLESFSAYAIITANSLTVGSFSAYPKDLSARAVLDFSLTPLSDIPTGERQNRAGDLQGFFQIKFMGLGWEATLGTGLTDKSKIPCKTVSGIVPGEQYKIFS